MIWKWGWRRGRKKNGEEGPGIQETTQAGAVAGSTATPLALPEHSLYFPLSLSLFPCTTATPLSLHLSYGNTKVSPSHSSRVLRCFVRCAPTTPMVAVIVGRPTDPVRWEHDAVLPLVRARFFFFFSSFFIIFFFHIFGDLRRHEAMKINCCIIFFFIILSEFNV